jgi:crossover junction endodeoxyribonuclease RuvC
VEDVFLAHNVKSAFKLGQARGAAVLAAATSNLPLYEYSALAVKQAVVGYGRADKHQVQALVQVLLNLDKLPEPNDVADALAVAICHLQTIKFKARCQVSAK